MKPKLFIADWRHRGFYTDWTTFFSKLKCRVGLQKVRVKTNHPGLRPDTNSTAFDSENQKKSISSRCPRSRKAFTPFPSMFYNGNQLKDEKNCQEMTVAFKWTKLTASLECIRFQLTFFKHRASWAHFPSAPSTYFRPFHCCRSNTKVSLRGLVQVSTRILHLDGPWKQFLYWKKIAGNYLFMSQDVLTKSLRENMSK